MSRESMQTLSDQVFRGKMPLFDGTAASTGLSKERTMSGFMSKQKVQYNGAYFAYEPREDDCAGFTPPWRSSKTSPLDDRSPVSHLSEMVAQNHMKYRKDSISAEEGQSHSSVCHTPVKKGFVPYTKSPEINSPAVASSVVLRKPKAGGESSSSPTENPVYIAIPKPVYGLNPCCNDVGCTMGQRYNLGHVSPRIPNTVYERDWMQSNGHYTEKAPIQRKDTLLQHKDFPFECNAEQLKRMTAEVYSPNRARTLPAVIEPSSSSYPCTPTRALFGCFRDHSSQALQTPPGAYPSLYAPRPAYEHMTSEVYQECSPMSKYGQLVQHPVFYYSQANAEVENRRQRKDSSSKQGEGAPFLHKHIISNPREHYIVSRPHHPEIPLSCTEMLPNHSLLRGFEYPCYTLPRFHLNASQIRAPQKRQHSLSAFHPAHINVPPSSQHIEHPIAKDKPNTSLYVDPLHSSSFLLMEQKSPSRRANQAAVSPSSLQASRLFQPFTVDASLLQPGVIMERVLDHSPYEAQVKQPTSLPVSPAAWLHQSPGHSSDLIHTAVPNHANVRKIIFSPTVKTGNKHNGLVSDTGSSDYKKCLKRSASHSSPPMKIKVEDKHSYEMECSIKRQKMEMRNLKGGNETDSPPMPVINNVFSLAPYQQQLQESGGRVPPKHSPTSEQHQDELKQKTNETKLNRNDLLVCPVSKEMSSSSADEADVEVFEPKIVKVEKQDSSNGDCRKDLNRVTIKNEPEEPRASDCESTSLQEKSDKLELKLLLAGENMRPADWTAQVKPSSQEDALQQQVLGLQPKSSTSLQPPASKVNFKSIPPHCLKLSTYNIIIPDGKHCRTVPPLQDKPQPLAVATSIKEFYPPVRKHFHELHQSLCSLVSKSVSSSSEQELRNWLTQLEITKPASQSDKVQKVSCLLGAKSREAWINEEVKSALREVLERLREYNAKTCPFPHVVRTGAVFLPMLVVKELLFPMVHSSFIDKILQEYKVELRPTTLSEEKILIQLHKRACSSRLRRLMSLKHLPDIYSEVVNLLYYTCVCKHLGLNLDSSFKEQHRSCEASSSSAPADTAASPASPSESAHHQTHMKDQETPPNKNITKAVENNSTHTPLDKNSFDDEDAGDPGETVGENAPENETKTTEDKAADQDCAVTPQSAASDSSWTCPLTLDELSPSDTEIENSSIELPHSSAHQLQFNHCSGVILKLRKMLSGSLNRKKTYYQAVSRSGTLGESPSVQTDDSKGVSSKNSLHRTPKAACRWKTKGSFSYALRPLSSPSKTKRTSLLKIKYCPYLSTCHSAEHRRRWVLRSAVQRARRAMRLSYPDLVGKKIRHLYEEDDKSEVWYRGEVLRVHEAHANPLKTIFEVKYDSEPEWKYYLELLIDYKKGWLKIED